MPSVPYSPRVIPPAPTSAEAKRILIQHLGCDRFRPVRLTRTDGRRDLFLNRIRTPLAAEPHVYISYRGIKHLIEHHPRSEARERFVHYALATLRWPSEAWGRSYHHPRTGRVHRRLLLGRFNDGRTIVVVDHQTAPLTHLLWTYYEARNRKGRLDIDKYRRGRLLWRRQTGTAARSAGINGGDGTPASPSQE